MPKYSWRSVNTVSLSKHAEWIFAEITHNSLRTEKQKFSKALLKCSRVKLFMSNPYFFAYWLLMTLACEPLVFWFITRMSFLKFEWCWLGMQIICPRVNALLMLYNVSFSLTRVIRLSLHDVCSVKHASCTSFNEIFLLSVIQYTYPTAKIKWLCSFINPYKSDPNPKTCSSIGRANCVTSAKVKGSIPKEHNMYRL